MFFSKFHKISSHGRNLISLKHQYIWTNSVVLAVFVDQIKNWVLQAYHKDLGPELTFKLWWFSFYLENLGITCIHQRLENECRYQQLFFPGLRLLFNVIVFFIAQIRFPEFDGLKGQRFPDTPPLRIQEILPRRPSLCFSETNQKLLLDKLKNKTKEDAHFNSALSIHVRPAQPVIVKQKIINISYI